MIRFWKVALLISLFAFSNSVIAQTNGRIGIINVRKVFDNYWKTKQGKLVLEQSRADAAKQDKELISGYQKAREEYQKILDSATDQTVSSEERDKRKKAAEAKLREIKATEQDIQLFERQAANKLDDQSRRMRENIVEEIRVAVKAKAKAAGYSLVLDTSEGADVTPVVVYNNGENDLTETILSQLNAGAPLESSKSDIPKVDDKQPK
jgi:outer membrane protein